MKLFKVKFPTGYQVQDELNDNLDFHLILDCGKVFFGTFFTLNNIRYLMGKNNDVYFWATDMVIVMDLRKDTLRESLNNMIDDANVGRVLSEIGTIQSIYNEVGTFDKLMDMIQ
jgi:hypothetical protein